MVSEHFDPRQQMVWSDSVGWYTPSRIPNPFRSLAPDRPYSSSASARRPWPFRSIASSSGSGANREARPVRPSSLSGYGGGPYQQELGVIGLGSSACKIPSRFQSELALEPHLPRQNPDSSDLRRRRGPAELALAVSGPAGGGLDRGWVKVPGSIPGKTPNPSSDLGRMTKPVVRYEADASDSTAVWRILHLRPSEEPRNVPDQIQPAEVEMETTRRIDELRRINLNSTQGIQPMRASEGNFSLPSTGVSVVATGCGEDPLLCSSWASSTVNHQNPSQEPALDRQWLQNPKENLSQSHPQYQAKQWDSNPSNKRDLSVSTVDDDLSYSNNMKIEQMEQTKVKAKLCSVEYQPRWVPGKEILEQEVYGIDPYTHNLPKEIVPADLDWSIDDKAEEKKGVNESGDEDKINKDIAVKTNFVMANVPDEAKFYLTQLYMVGRDDRWLWSTGLLWKPPPWPDFCAMGGDSVAQHGGYEVLVNFHSVKKYHISLDKTFELNDYCYSHQPPISLSKAEVCGLFGSVFCDFGPEITVLDVDGEDPHTGITASISKDNPALVSCDDEEADFHMRQGALPYNSDAQMLPKGYHCVSRRLMLEYSKFSSLDSDEPFACKLNNPKHRDTYKQVNVHVLNYEAILWEKLPKFSMQQLYFVGLLWNLPPWPDLSFCEVNWMANGMEKGAGTEAKKDAYNAVTGQSKIYSQQAKSKPFIEDTIKNAIEDSTTWPVRKVIPISPGDYNELELKLVGTLEVKLVQARDLANKDVIGKSDPFAILYAHPLPDTTKRSKTINNNLNPIWNEHSEFTVEDVDTQSVTVKIYDVDGIQESEMIGCVQVGPKDLQTGKVKDVWLKLVQDLEIQRDMKNRGQAHLELLYCPINMKEDGFPSDQRYFSRERLNVDSPNSSANGLRLKSFSPLHGSSLKVGRRPGILARKEPQALLEYSVNSSELGLSSHGILMSGQNKGFPVSMTKAKVFKLPAEQATLVAGKIYTNCVVDAALLSSRVLLMHQVTVWELIRVLFSERAAGNQLEPTSDEDQEGMILDKKEGSDNIDLEALPLVSESQFTQVLNIELDQIIEACKFLDENWSPKFTLIVAQKNHRTKFFLPSSPDNVFPGSMFAIFFFLNALIWRQRSSGADPIVNFCETVVDTFSMKCLIETHMQRNKITMTAELLEKGLAEDIENDLVSFDSRQRKDTDFFWQRYLEDVFAARSIWAFGFDKQGLNILLDDTLSVVVGKNLPNAVKDSMFQWVNCLREMFPGRMLTSLKHLMTSLLLRRGQCQKQQNV